MGFEPTTSCLEGRNSTAELHPHNWSERWDSNPRPSAPKADALPSCATPRHLWSLARARGFVKQGDHIRVHLDFTLT